MVDIDHPPRQPLAHGGRDDLHVARQHDQIDIALVDFLHHALFLFGLAGRRDRQVQVLDVVGLRQPFRVGMIGNDQRNVDGQLAQAHAIEQVEQAVQVFGDHDQDPGAIVGPHEFPAHLKLAGLGIE